MCMKLVLVEDDHLQAERLLNDLRLAFPQATCELIKTESEFRNKLDAFVERPPDAIVMDVMIRWTDPTPDMAPPPKDVKGEDYFRAGVRCAKLLEERGVHSPIILYTILDAADLKEDLAKVSKIAIHLRKEASSESLVRRIRELTQGG